MEDFSQSRGDDDLFDDEIIRIESTPEIEAVTSRVQEVSLDSAPVDARNRTSVDAYARGSRGRSRGGNVPRGGQRSGLQSSRFAPSAPLEASPAIEVAVPLNDPAEVPETAPEDDTLSKTASNPAIPAAPTPSKPAAVRGDRTATGGIKKAKLTEDELNAKLAAAKERSQNLSAAHARAQADAASFEQREKVAHEKRAKDAVNRKVMDNEREKNRARKMAVMGGREWDAEKNEEDFKIPQSGRGRGRSNQMRAMNGNTTVDRRDPAMDDTRQYEWQEDRGRGRGNRGRGRGGRGGRGDSMNGVSSHDKQPDLNAETDFPSLPASVKTKEETSTPARPPPTRTELDILSPSEDKGTWADQVESEAARA